MLPISVPYLHVVNGRLALKANRVSSMTLLVVIHELWIRSNDKSTDSIGKFHAILALCARLGVGTSPTRVPLSAGDHVWLVPLFS